MNDLLSAVKAGDDGVLTDPHGVGRYRQAEESAPDIEAGPSAPAAGVDKHMEEFFSDVAHVRGYLAVVKRNLHKLQQAHERGKHVTRQQEMKDIRDAMQEDIDEVNKTAHLCKAALEKIDGRNEDARKRKGCGEGSSQDRTRTSITASLRKKLKDLMSEFQELRTKLNKEYRDVVERRYYTVTGQKISEEDLENMIESGESETIFQKAILDQGMAGRGQVLDTLQDIQDRHTAVREMERKLLELHQIFLDMAVLVEAQGEMLDNIEAQVAKSVEYVAAGTTSLVSAKALQKNTRK
mmetsp:Transcript_49880/g.159521  ORF Transcript_49880/g.159521 Transcript_49880/m.159521 type:complete len:295 (+) Transcript_49880:196-1080(+)